jgi:hypothetical protein
MDGPWVVYFQNCVRWPRPPSMMAAMSRHSFNIEPYGSSRLWRPCLLMDWDEMSNVYRGPAINISYQVSVMNRNLVGTIYGRSSIRSAHFVPIHWQTWPPPAILVSDWSISRLLMDWDEMSNLYRGPAIDAFYQVSVHLAKRFQRRFFRNQPIRNKNGLWCLAKWIEMW